MEEGTMTAYDDLEPVAGDVANTYEWMFDINTGTAAAPVWTNVPEITGLDPQFTATLDDISTYANKGKQSQIKSGETFVLNGNVLKKRVPGTNLFYPWYMALKNAADAIGVANKIGFRFYDALGADEAYQGTVLVAHPKRQNTGTTGAEFAQFALTGGGDVVPIDNPLAGTQVPLITGVDEVTASAPPITGQLVSLFGDRFDGVTGLKVGAVAVTEFNVISAQVIAFVMPSGAAGSAPITVTNGAGVSAGFPLTRGA
jgi:hypothetical protein